jgi:hypothetical protein
MRVLAGLVLLLASACGGQEANRLGTQTTPAGGTVPSVTALPSSQATDTAGSPPVGMTTAQVTAGTGQATVTGTTTPGTPRPSTPPATIRPTAGTTVVSDDATGTRVYLHVGQRLEVHLTQGTYDPPVSTTSVLVRRSSTGGYPTTEPVLANFEAVGRGTSDVTATSDAACFHTQPRCLMPTRVWVVHVTVG